MSSDLVPFGKHKGKPVDVMLADPGYREWVLQQPWVKDRYPTFHQTIINIAGEPAETPEHNELQAGFLDDARCLALARLLLPAGAFDGGGALRLAQRDMERHGVAFARHTKLRFGAASVWSRGFEVEGWDVVFTIAPAWVDLDLASLPPCSCECDHERDCPPRAECRGGDARSCQHRHERGPVPTFEQWQEAEPNSYQQYSHRSVWSGDYYNHCGEDCPWSKEDASRWLLLDDARRYVPRDASVLVECKPDLGDDYPAVLRQVTRRETRGGEVPCVLVRRHQFGAVTWEQVTEIFRASGITLIDERRLQTPPVIEAKAVDAEDRITNNTDGAEGRQEGARP